MPEKKRPKLSSYSLIFGEDTYVNQNAQGEIPTSARRIKSLIPSADATLVRELAEPAYLPTNLGAPVIYLFEFDQNDNNGNVTRTFFAATATQLFTQSGGAWVVVSAVGTLNGPIQMVVINNLLQMNDGSNTWLFDGTNWVRVGFPLPQNPPQVDTSQAGSLTIQTNRFYWTTTADETTNRVHESSSSPISVGTGAQASKTITVTPQPGTVQVNNGSAAVVGTNTLFTKAVLDVGGQNGVPTNPGGYTYNLYVNGINFGQIASVTDDTHLTLVNAAGSNQTSSSLTGYGIFPIRATKWHVYASEGENSKVGFFLATIALPITVYSDQSPFLGTAGSLFLSINRPIRNDPPPGSSIVTMHKFRLFRRRDKKPNFFNFTANEEVSSGNNGSPQESVPGADVNTFSDLINETSYPIQANRIRALTSHADALYIGTETNCLPFYGESIDDFAISQVTAFSVGIAGQNAMISTPHGLAFVSYDKKVYLYPTSNYPWAFVPKDINVTSQLIELSKPKRKDFEAIDSSQLDKVFLTYYNYGRRQWLVLSYQDKNLATRRTWIFDFEIKCWFELQRGFTSTAVFEVSAGNKVLVGGDSAGNTWVIDDLTGTFSTGANLPASLFRTVLIDFKDPDHYHVFRYIEIEFSALALKDSITLNYYLDPTDADNPATTGVARTLTLTQVRGANLFRAFPKEGNLCKRMMVEVNFAADTNTGAIRGIKLVAEQASGIIF